jgi:hypothetical protein
LWQSSGLENRRGGAHIAEMRKYTTADLALIEQEIKDHSEGTRVEWLRVSYDGFRSREERLAFLEANTVASKRFADLLDKRTEIKEALAK